MLADGHAVYTPGLSQNRAGVSSYYANDLLGNLWTVDGSSKNQLSYEDTTGFGALTAGSIGGQPFGYGGGNNCQTEADTGLVLMGHRYYDTRIGRFISQDPAGDGDNWYAYAGNSPTNYTDPTGLIIAGGFDDPSQDTVPYNSSNAVDAQYMQDNPGEYNFYLNGQYNGSKWMGATAFDQMSMGGDGMGPEVGGGVGIFNHTNGARPSTEGIHQKGMGRLKRDNGGEKGDKTRAAKEAEKKANKTGVSTRDPDGSIRRAREAQIMAQDEEEQFETSRPGVGYVGNKSGGPGGGGAAEAGAAGAGEEGGMTAEELLEFLAGLL